MSRLLACFSSRPSPSWLPLLLGLLPIRGLPNVVLEIVAGIIIGPSVLGWVRIDLPLQILALIGLAFLLFLSGLEVDLARLRGRISLVVGAGFLLSFGLALLAGYGFAAGGLVRSPLLIAIILSATALGVVVPVLKDAGESGSNFGQLVIAAATIAEFGTIILLSLFFSGEVGGTGTKLIFFAGFILFALLVVRGLPTILYRSRIGTRPTIVAGLLQATSLSFIVTATQIGMELGLLSRANGAALIAAGVLSVVIFPLLALTVLRSQATISDREPAAK